MVPAQERRRQRDADAPPAATAGPGTCQRPRVGRKGIDHHVALGSGGVEAGFGAVEPLEAQHVAGAALASARVESLPDLHRAFNHEHGDAITYETFQMSSKCRLSARSKGGRTQVGMSSQETDQGPRCARRGRRRRTSPMGQVSGSAPVRIRLRSVVRGYGLPCPERSWSV